MKRMRTLTAMAAASLLACAIPQSASAALVALPPNTAALLITGDTTTIASLGSLVTTQPTVPLNTPVFTGTFAAAVYYNSGNSGPLTFVYTIHQTSSGSLDKPPQPPETDPITHVSIGGFSGTESVGYINSAANPQYASSSFTGTTIGFSGFIHGAFDGIGDGNDSIVVIQTAAFNWQLVNATVSDSQSANIQTYGVAPIPEPTTLVAGALLLLPFAASTLRMVRKSRAA
jgi:hypothetical protein